MIVTFTPALVMATLKCIDINTQIQTFDFGNMSDPANAVAQQATLLALKDGRHALIYEVVSGLPLFIMITIVSVMHLRDVMDSVDLEYEIRDRE